MVKKKPHELPRVQLRRERASSQLGGAVGGYLPPGAQYDYKTPSVFAEYRVLTAVFGLIALAALLYWAFWPSHARSQRATDVPAVTSPAPDGDRKPDPVYVEPIAPR